MKVIPLNTGEVAASFLYKSSADGAAKKDDEFARIEDKYIIHRSKIGLVLGEIKKWLSPCYPDITTQYTLIESLYFDSEELDFFQHHFMAMEDRYKLRVRRYGPNGIWNDGPALLELKRKNNGVSKKYRFKVSHEHLKRFSHGGKLYLDNTIRSMNPTIKESSLLKRIKKINVLQDRYNLKPRMAIRYKRFAFEGDNFRATVDCDLHREIIRPVRPESAMLITSLPIWEKAIKIKNKLVQDEHLILELKHPGSIPFWADHLIESAQTKKSGFSKYCWSMSSFIQDITEGK